MVQKNIKDLLIFVLILIFILIVVRIINKKIIENFEEGIAGSTNNEAKTLNNIVNTNKDQINSLQLQANDTVKLNDVTDQLYNSVDIPTKNEILTKRNEEINDLFNKLNGKFKKHDNRKCDYLDINPPIPCQDVNGENDGITDCQINCAKNCIKDPRCISFEYDRRTKSCKLSSSCYSGNITYNNNKDLYFKKGAKVPAVAQFKRIPNKKCKSDTKISQNGSFNNKTLSECANECLNNTDCISFEFKDNPGINNNICNLTNDCHKYNYIDNNNTDLFMKNNVIVKKTDRKNKLIPPNDNKRKIPFVKRIQFFERKNYQRPRHYNWDFWSNQNNLRPSNLKYDRQNDDYDSVKIPPHTRIDMNQDYNFRGRHSGWTTGKGGLNISNLDDHHIKRNKVSSWQIRNTK